MREYSQKNVFTWHICVCVCACWSSWERVAFQILKPTHIKIPSHSKIKKVALRACWLWQQLGSTRYIQCSSVLLGNYIYIYWCLFTVRFIVFERQKDTLWMFFVTSHKVHMPGILGSSIRMECMDVYVVFANTIAQNIIHDFLGKYLSHKCMKDLLMKSTRKDWITWDHHHPRSQVPYSPHPNPYPPILWSMA